MVTVYLKVGESVKIRNAVTVDEAHNAFNTKPGEDVIALTCKDKKDEIVAKFRMDHVIGYMLGDQAAPIKFA